MRSNSVGPPPETVLILTPVKNASRFLDTYFAGLDKLSYPASSTSLGFLESDSDDGTFERIRERLGHLRRRYASAEIWQKNFNFRIPQGFPRWTHAFQIPRRKILAKARNHLLFRALKEQDWVMWLDVDVIDYPLDLIELLIAARCDIVHPHCVKRYGGPTFDLNAWRDHGRMHMEDLRGGPDLVRLDAVGGTVLLVRADVHRDGLVFPCFPYGVANPAVRPPSSLRIHGELETEGFGILAMEMGYQCWGMPNLEVLHPPHDG
jgi:Anp1